MAEYAKAGVGNTALGLSIGALATELLGGTFGNVLGGANSNCGCSDDHWVNRYEAAQSARISELETEVKLRDANTYTLTEMGKLRDYVDHRFSGVEAQLCNQAVLNSQITANISCMSGQIATLMNLTKTVIPIGNVCPAPMPQYNSWTAPTTTTTG